MASVRPRVALFDLADWDSFASLAASVRRRGLDVIRVSVRPHGLAGTLSRPLDRLVFGPQEVLLPDDHLTPGVVAQALAPPTVDVQGSEEVIGPLRSGPWPDAPVARRVPDPDDALLLYDKLAMSRRAEALGLSVPQCYDTPPAGQLPLVVKGRLGAGGQAVRIAEDAAGLAAALAELDPAGEGLAFTQEFRAGALVNFGGVARDGRLLAGAPYRALSHPDDPLGPPDRVEVVSCPGIERDLPVLLADLRYTGFLCVDYVVEPDGRVNMIDFNPRVFAGWLALQVAGVPLLDAYLSLFGLAPEPAPVPAPVGAQRSVRTFPDGRATTWAGLREESRTAIRATRAARPTTGAAFAASAALRGTRVVGRQAVRMVRDR